MTGHTGTEKTRLAPPPDGGWGWPVTIASFLIHLILDGITYSFGVFAVGLIDYFEASRQDVGWVGSIMIGVTYGTGPIASVLCSRFGCRPVTIVGSLVAALGLVLSIFAPTIQVMFVTFGVITGFGLGMTYLPAIVCVAYYFDQKRSLAIGIACCGSGIGTFIFGSLAGILLKTFGWRGGMLIEAGLVLNCVAFGMIFVEPALPVRRLEVQDKTVLSHDTTVTTLNLQGNEKGREENAKNAAEEQLRKSIEFSTTSGGDIVGNGKSRERSGSMHSVPPSKNAEASMSFTRHKSEETVAILGQAEPKDTAREKNLSRSVLNLPNYRSNPNLFTTPNELPADSDDLDEQKQEKKGLLSKINSLMDFSLLLDPLFLMFGISNFLTSVGYLVPYLFLPDRAKETGYTEDEGALLITIVGGANTVGRVVFGFVADLLSTQEVFNRTFLYSTALTIVGILTVLSIFGSSYIALCMYSASFGFLMGVYVLLTSVVLVDLLSVDKLSNSFGLVLLFQGIASLIGPPIAGAIFDSTGNYDASFWINGLLVATSGAMLYFYNCMPSYRERAKEVKEVGIKNRDEKKAQRAKYKANGSAAA